MEKNYEEVKAMLGSTIMSAMTVLESYKQQGKLACTPFNGVTLYSDVDDLDSAYLKITGKTHSEHTAAIGASVAKSKAEEAEHKDKTPALVEQWTARGIAELDPQYHEFWIKCVPIRLSDLYKGMELGCCLDIVNPLNKGASLETCAGILDSQGHSGMSHGLVRGMIRSFCARGEEFFERTKC